MPALSRILIVGGGIAGLALGRALREHGFVPEIIELARLWNPVGLCVGIARGELHRILLDGAAGVPMRLGTTLTTLSQKDDEVDVAFSDGSTGTYDIVVGADGIHSSIRQLVFGGIRPRYLGQASWRFLVDHSGAIETWTAMLGQGRAVQGTIINKSGAPRDKGRRAAPPSRLRPLCTASTNCAVI